MSWPGSSKPGQLSGSKTWWAARWRPSGGRWPALGSMSRLRPGRQRSKSSTRPCPSSFGGGKPAPGKTRCPRGCRTSSGRGTARPCEPWAMSAELFAEAPDDAAAREVVDRHLHADLVQRLDADVPLGHLAGQARQHHVAVGDLDFVEAVGHCFPNDAVHLDGIVLLGLGAI